MTNVLNIDLQAKYWQWHEEGMALAFQFTQECNTLIREIYDIFHDDCEPSVRCLTVVPFDNNDTFESAWIDDKGRPCCAAMLDDGAPMGYRVEHLDLDIKQRLHKLLQTTRNELVA